MRPKITLALLVLAMATSVVDTRGQGARTQETVDDRLRRVDEFVWDGALFMKGRRTLQQIRTLSTLLSEKIEKAPNPHVAGQIDEFRTLTFVGLELYGLVTPTLEFW